MHIGSITIELRLPGCRSLKEKRGRIKPLLTSLHRKFNVSAAEIGQNDHWQFSVIACVIVSNNAQHVQKLLAGIPDWIERQRPDMQLIDDHIMLL